MRRWLSEAVDALIDGLSFERLFEVEVEEDVMDHPSCAHCTRPSPIRTPIKWQGRTVSVCPGCLDAIRKGKEAPSVSSDSTNYAASSRHGDLDWIERHAR